MDVRATEGTLLFLGDPFLQTTPATHFTALWAHPGLICHLIADEASEHIVNARTGRFTFRHLYENLLDGTI
jgi:hypothetical protein